MNMTPKQLLQKLSQLCIKRIRIKAKSSRREAKFIFSQRYCFEWFLAEGLTVGLASNCEFRHQKG